MAKKKAELAAERDEYDRLLAAARSSLAAGMFQEVVRHSLAALPFVDGMMEYRRRFEDAEFKSVTAIDNILRYAPLIFSQSSLNMLEETLRAQKRIDRNATDDLAGRLAEAKREVWLNHRLWTHLEQSGQARQDELRLTLGGDQEYWRWTCEAWEVMGLLNRSPSRGSYILSLKTRSGEVVRAKCSTCGKAQEAPKAMFFEELACPECRTTCFFVILAA